jgi:hypothetical protein
MTNKKLKLIKLISSITLSGTAFGLIPTIAVSCGKKEDIHVNLMYFDVTSIGLDLDVPDRNTYQLVAHIQPKEAAEKFKNKIQ